MSRSSRDSGEEDPRLQIGLNIVTLTGPLFWIAAIFFTTVGYYGVTNLLMGMPMGTEAWISLGGWLCMCIGAALWLRRRRRLLQERDQSRDSSGGNEPGLTD